MLLDEIDKMSMEESRCMFFYARVSQLHREHRLGLSLQNFFQGSLQLIYLKKFYQHPEAQQNRESAPSCLL